MRILTVGRSGTVTLILRKFFSSTAFGNVADDVLRRDLARDVRDRAEHTLGDLRGISAGADLQRVVAFIGRLFKITDNILINAFERILDASARLVGELLRFFSPSELNPNATVLTP